MLREIGTIRERLTALRALIGLRLAHVRLRVQLQLRLGPEDLEKRSKIDPTVHKLQSFRRFFSQNENNARGVSQGSIPGLLFLRGITNDFDTVVKSVVFISFT